MMDKFIILFIFLIFSFIRIINSSDSIIPSQSIRDGETLVSAGGTFELGFFSPGISRNRYLGVWYKNMSPLTIVWVANRETPLNNTFGVLRVNNDGVLMLLNATKSTVWSSNMSTTAENPIARLLDSGNLVVKDGHDNNEGHLLWQSFDYPGNTLLPGMKLGWNLETGLDRFLSSWKSDDDPSQGEYIVKIDIRGYPQLVAMKGTVIEERVGSWNGLHFTAVASQPQHGNRTFEFVLNKKEIYFEFQVPNRSFFSRDIVTPIGIKQWLDWTSKANDWELVASAPANLCHHYALCGANSICNIFNSPVCSCLKGFEPKYQEEWNMSIWSNGCIRIIPLGCHSKYDFKKYTGIKLPDTSSSLYNKTMDLEQCHKSCLANCSCNAYANLDIRSGGSGCLLWFDDLIDSGQSPQGGQDLYIRSLASELDHVEAKIHRNTSKKKLTGFVTAFAILIMGTITFAFTICIWRKKLIKPGMRKKFYSQHCQNKLREEHVDLPTFDFSIIAKATDDFSSRNKLGEGGFGPVYKGTLAGGQDIAVKRLSKNSGQGLEEFKNEVMLIAKLQHRNLVRLLGCCIRGAEKILIYEYMPNKSLDYFISDATSKKLDWFKRFQIIGGIARGLLYLHQHSRLRIIHRDLKASNILLDANMNPKISDFGLARTLWGDQVEANTNKVAGTCGYLSPEYAASGHFSIKSDVFSFGVIVLEIVCGKKSRKFSDSEHYLNLPGHAWKLWTEERPLELIDELLSERCTPSEVIRCIHVGLLCVQQKPEDRPEMSSVVLMLNGEKALPKLKVPGFYTGGDIPESDSASKNYNSFSPNEMSLTEFEAR